MSKKIALSLTAFALAASVLSGCGTAVTGMSTATATTASAKGFVSVTTAQNDAYAALSQYNNLRNQWLAAPDDQSKDNIDDQMLVVLSQGLGQVRNAVSGNAGAAGYDSRQVYNIADAAISQYEGLRQQWAMTNDINQQRVISNQMQTIMVNALEQVENVAPYSPYAAGDDSLANSTDSISDTVKHAGAKRPTPPKAKLLKKVAKKK